MISVVVLSPIPALRAGLSALVEADPELVVVASAAGLGDLPELPEDTAVVVATPDALGGLDEENLAPLFHASANRGILPGMGVSLLLLTADPEEARDLAGLELHAWGLLSPEAPAEMLQAAVHALAEGLVAAPPQALQAWFASQQPARLPGSRGTLDDRTGDEEDEAEIDRITGREEDVLRLLAEGLTNKQIALALQISEHTVKFHVSSIYSKLGVSNRAEAVRKGARRGLVPL